MGFELGPKPLRRAPKSWIPARAFAMRHSVYDHPDPEGTETVFDTSFGLTVTWRVEIDGRDPYELEEERSAPTWTLTGPVGAGKRWYKVRVRPTYGLMPELGVPCFADPADPSKIWIDWDAAYDEHVPAWEREARVRRGVSDRENPYDKVVGRIVNPFAGKLREGEEQLVQERIDKLPKPTPVAPVPDGESAELKRRMDDFVRIQREGENVKATVVERTHTDRKLANVPAIQLTFELDGGRRIVFEHVFGPRHADHYYKIGKRVDVWIDPLDPDNICPGR